MIKYLNAVLKNTSTYSFSFTPYIKFHQCSLSLSLSPKAKTCGKKKCELYRKKCNFYRKKGKFYRKKRKIYRKKVCKVKSEFFM